MAVAQAFADFRLKWPTLNPQHSSTTPYASLVDKAICRAMEELIRERNAAIVAKEIAEYETNESFEKDDTQLGKYSSVIASLHVVLDKIEKSPEAAD